MTDEYPSWRKALFGSDAVANLRCAIKYVVWHGAYAVLALFGGLLYIGATVVDKLRSNERASGAVNRTVHSPRARKIGTYIFSAISIAYLAGALAYILYILALMLMENALVTIVTLGAIVLLSILLIAGLVYLGPRVKGAAKRGGRAASSGWKKTVEVSKDTPGLRRVIGKCPVSLDIEPRWFEKLFGN